MNRTVTVDALERERVRITLSGEYSIRQAASEALLKADLDGVDCVQITIESQK